MCVFIYLFIHSFLISCTRGSLFRNVQLDISVGIKYKYNTIVLERWSRTKWWSGRKVVACKWLTVILRNWITCYIYRASWSSGWSPLWCITMHFIHFIYYNSLDALNIYRCLYYPVLIVHLCHTHGVGQIL